jgi:hypothetical protein
MKYWLRLSPLLECRVKRLGESDEKAHHIIHIKGHELRGGKGIIVITRDDDDRRVL